MILATFIVLISDLLSDNVDVAGWVYAILTFCCIIAVLYSIAEGEQ